MFRSEVKYFFERVGDNLIKVKYKLSDKIHFYTLRHLNENILQIYQINLKVSGIHSKKILVIWQDRDETRG